VRRLLAACGALLMLVGSACGGGATASSTPSGKIKQIDPGLIPAEVVGLKVAPEDVSSTVKKSHRAFVEALTIYSMREGDKLMATLQVTRANDPGAKNLKRFRDAVIGQIGSSQPRTMVVQGRNVYVSTGTKQRIAFWFEGRYLFVLATRDEFKFRRTLLREMLAVKV
jgi:hypothetical protein